MVGVTFPQSVMEIKHYSLSPVNIAPFNSIAGSTSQSGTYTSLSGTAQVKSVENSDNIGTNRYFTFSVTKPIITLSTASLSGFSYPEGNGPSNILSFNVSGRYLTGNVTLQSTAHYEISTLGGNAFTPTDPVTLTVVGNALASTPVYVRLKAGLSMATYTDTIKVQSADAAIKEVKLTGNVTVAPAMTVNPSSLSSFSYNFGSGPSTAQSFIVSGTNLVANVNLTAPSDFEISLQANAGYTNSILLPPTGGTLTNTTIYVRMKWGLGTEPHEQDIQINSTYAATKTVHLTGIVNPSATIFHTRSFLPVFIYTQGSGPSGIQTFEVSGTHLSANIEATAPTNFQVSLNGSSWSSSITLTRSGSTVSPTTLYVRMNASLSANTFGPSSLTLTSTGATTKSLSVSGRVVATNSRIMMSSANTVSGFGYHQAAGDNVEFATAVNNDGSPAINNLVLDADRTVGSLINLTNNKLIIPTAKTLIVNGSINTNNENKIIIKAAENAVNGSLIFLNEINPVYGTVEMWSKGYVDGDCEQCPNDMYHW
jgi:hypothetical protein